MNVLNHPNQDIGQQDDHEEEANEGKARIDHQGEDEEKNDVKLVEYVLEEDAGIGFGYLLLLFVP